MASFRYRAKDSGGKELDGLMMGDDERAVAARLREMGYYVLEVRAVRERSGATWNPVLLVIRWLINPVFASASPGQLAVFYRQFSTVVKSGMTVAEAVSILRTQGGSRVLRRIARETLPFVQSGGRLSDSFARYPWVFPELHISLLRAGEQGGTLDKMLDRIADYMEREVGIRQKLRLATLYPKILFLALIFIPKFPILILGTLRAYLLACLAVLVPFLIGVFVLWAAYRILYQLAPLRYAADLVKLCIPRIGGTVRMLALARFYRVVSAMFAAGATAGEALDHGASAAGNWYLTVRLRTAIPGVRQGRSLSESLERAKVVPRMALDMLKTGEQTGNLDSMLDKAAEYTENEAQVATIQLTVILGVLLLLGVAVYVGRFVIDFYAGQYADIVNQQ